MAKAESEVKARVEVRTLRTTGPDEIVKLTVGPKPVELFEAMVPPKLKALRRKEEILVKASWSKNVAYGIEKGGRLADNPHFLKQGEKMQLRARSNRGILSGIPNSSQITHLRPGSKK